MIVRDKEERIRTAVGTYNVATDEFDDSKVLGDGVVKYRASVRRELVISVTGSGADVRETRVPVDDMTDEQILEAIKSHVRRLSR